LTAALRVKDGLFGDDYMVIIAGLLEQKLIGFF
jgi:hypothetical protein